MKTEFYEQIPLSVNNVFSRQYDYDCNTYEQYVVYNSTSSNINLFKQRTEMNRIDLIRITVQ
jgi:hypothetical protein